MTVVEWRRHDRGALRGFVTVETPSGIVVHGIAVFEQAGRRWTKLPTRPRLSGGKAITDKSGGFVSDPIIEIPDRDRKDAWDVSVLDALGRYQSEQT